MILMGIWVCGVCGVLYLFTRMGGNAKVVSKYDSKYFRVNLLTASLCKNNVLFNLYEIKLI